MTDIERQELKQKIQEKITKTTESIKEMEAMTQPITPENSIGRVSRMDAINTKGVNEAVLRKAREKLAKLQMALSKIDAPSFGVCTRCKRNIPPMRLMFMPESSKCVHCADK